MPTIPARERLILALDVPDIDAARAMVTTLDGLVDFFKVGLTLQLAPGAERFIHELLNERKRVFLDYKYYDIPETVYKAVERAAELGVTFLTVHGPGSTMRKAAEGRTAGNLRRRREGELKLFTVTVLTSMDAGDMSEMGYTSHSVEQLVLFRARKALEAGCDGVIASGREARQIKEMSETLLVVTPGIRQDGSPGDDQKRRTTPGDAILAGADYLVVGRPITVPDLHATPRQAAEAVLGEMQQAFDKRGRR